MIVLILLCQAMTMYCVSQFQNLKSLYQDLRSSVFIQISPTNKKTYEKIKLLRFAKYSFLIFKLYLLHLQGPTLAYDGLHDRSLKHYYRDNNIKRHIQKMNSPPGQKSREKSVRNFIDDTMASVDYRLKPGPISPYAIPQIGSAKPKPVPRRPKALISVDEYMKTKRGSKRR